MLRRSNVAYYGTFFSRGENMLGFLQKLGRSLMLPVAVLPAAGLILGVGHFLEKLGVGRSIAIFMENAGNGILGQLGLLFAIGVALGMAKKNDGAVALAAVVGFFTVKEVLKPESVAKLYDISLKSVNLGFEQTNNQNVLIGILIGLIAAGTYNRFSETELPMALAFFSGKRLVPIMTAVFGLVLASVLLVVWPVVYSGLIQFSEWILNFGAVGAGLYGFFNRLLIPTGLHHALNAVFWFDIAGINDIQKFQSGEGVVKGITGRYQAGFFPVMMFGMPAAALAMYHTAKTANKKRVAGLLLAGAISSFVVGVTEPIEFAFMFAAPLLFVLHALLTGLSLFIAALFQWTAGFTLSAGLFDYILSLINASSNQPLMLLVQGVVFFVIYYVVFRAAIQLFNLKTPGRLKATDDAQVASSEVSSTTGHKYETMALHILEGLGGKDNIASLTNCATRLRLELHDNSMIDQEKIKAAGAVGVTVSGQRLAQVIIGTHVQQVANEMENHLN